jgi:small subunit ribosomal protein S11
MSEEKESTPAPEENEAATEPQEETAAPEPQAKAEEPAQEEAPEAEAPAAKEEAPAAKEEEPVAEEKAKEEPKAEGDSPEEAEEEAKPVKKEETAEDLLKSELAEVKIRRAKGSKNITHGIVHVTATFNNTKVNITDMKGNTISWSSSGKCNFRGSRKSTAYAAQVVTMDAGRVAMSHGLKEVVVKVCGPGMGRDSAVRALQSLGLAITSIVDVTPVPHNGCRPPKRRRV